MGPKRVIPLQSASPTVQELTYGTALSREHAKMSRDQQEFIDVLWNLCGRSRNLPRNPIEVLDREVYQAWIQARVEFGQRKPEYSVHRGTRIWRYGWDSDAVRAARPVIERWTANFFLGAPWIADEVERHFLRRLEQSRPPLFGEWPGAAILTRESPPKPPTACMGIITIPFRLKGVTKAAHRKTCYRLVDECIAQCQGSGRAKPTPVGRRLKAGKYEYRHVDFLALRACGMQWDEILRRYKRGGYKGSAKAVMAGAKDVALKIGVPWPIRLKP